MKKWLFIGYCFANLSLAAQTQINPVIQVERLYDADLIEVTKPPLDTSVPDSLQISQTLIQYSILDKPLLNLYEFIPLSPAVVRSYEEPGTRYGYLDLAIGYPWTPRGDILLQAPIRSRWYIGLQARHRSLLHQDRRMTTDGRITLEHRGKKNTFRINVLGEHLNNKFAVVDMLSLPGLDYQNYYKAGTEMEAYSLNNIPGSWHYHLKFGYHHAKNRITGPYDSLPVIRENILNIEASTGYNLAKGLSLNLEANARFASNRWTLNGISASRAVINAFPHVVWSGERFKAGIGLRVGYLLESDNNKFGIFPWFDAHFKLIRDWLTLYAKTNGYHLLNTYQDRITENPWIFADQMYDATVPWDVQAGFTGTVGDLFHYRIYGAYRYTKNQFFFGTQILQQGYPGLYMFHYSDETRYTAGSSLSFHSRRFGMGISGEWHQYILSSNNPPWHKPVWEVRGYARYNWRERIILTATGYWRDTCFAPDWSAASSVVTIPGFLDLGVRLEYVINRMFSAYFMGSNLLNREISYYYLYRNPGLTFGGGLTFRF